MDVNVKVLSDYYVIGEEEQVAGNNAGQPSQSTVQEDRNGRGSASVSAGDRGVNGAISCSRDSTNQEYIVWRQTPGELSFNETHFANDVDQFEDEKLFKSLELDRSDVEKLFNEDHPHSVDDMAAMTSWNQSRRVRKSTNSRPQSGQPSKPADDSDDDVDLETMKNKIKSVWNNATNGWLVKTTTSFKRDSSIWLLGVVYREKVTTKKEKSVSKNGEELSAVETNPFEQFKSDFRSRIWLTYRTDFPTIAGSHLKSDVGWGCMVRCGQMVLAQALLVHFLGREWSWNSQADDRMHRQIIRYFGDIPDDCSPFSIHRLVKIGSEQLNRKPGDWYGPSSVAHTLREALRKAQEEKIDERLNNLSIYIANDGVVYRQDVLDEYRKGHCIATDETSSSPASAVSSSAVNGSSYSTSDRALILLVPLRLGAETVNPSHIPCIKTLLNMQQCLGLIGGKPKHSLYFIGWQDDKLIHLDPHCCQDYVNVMQENFPLNTFHCSSPRKLSFSKMDPSCTIGFYCRNRTELDQMFIEIPKIVSLPTESHYPLFQIEPGRYMDIEDSLNGLYRKDNSNRQPNSAVRPNSNDEFTFI